MVRYTARLMRGSPVELLDRASARVNKANQVRHGASMRHKYSKESYVNSQTRICTPTSRDDAICAPCRQRKECPARLFSAPRPVVPHGGKQRRHIPARVHENAKTRCASNELTASQPARRCHLPGTRRTTRQRAGGGSRCGIDGRNDNHKRSRCSLRPYAAQPPVYEEI